MLGTTMGGLRHVGLDFFVAMASAARRGTTVPLILHLDHGADYETVRACIEAGFDSVMIDASAQRYEENVALVRRVVALARRHGVAVEAQVGETRAEEGGEGIERKTTVAEATRFAADTGVDYLAVSVGSRPGQLGGAPPIDVPLVCELAQAVGIPLVLHGGTSVPADVVSAAIRAGVAKINIDAAVKGGFRDALRSSYGVDDPIVDTRVPLAEARRVAQAAVEQRLAMFGATGRAD
jgi:ketose-bisphosphate aldolase